MYITLYVTKPFGQKNLVRLIPKVLSSGCHDGRQICEFEKADENSEYGL